MFTVFRKRTVSLYSERVLYYFIPKVTCGAVNLKYCEVDLSSDDVELLSITL